MPFVRHLIQAESDAIKSALIHVESRAIGPKDRDADWDSFGDGEVEPPFGRLLLGGLTVTRAHYVSGETAALNEQLPGHPEL